MRSIDSRCDLRDDVCVDLKRRSRVGMPHVGLQTRDRFAHRRCEQLSSRNARLNIQERMNIERSYSTDRAS